MTKPKCRCAGHWSRKLVHYVRLAGSENHAGQPVIKCRLCYKKWRSRTLYARRLPEYVERKYTRLTDKQLLGLIKRGRIKVDFETGEIQKERKYARTWTGKFIVLKQRLDADAAGVRKTAKSRGRLAGGPYYYVVICDCGRRQEPSVAKVVWMAYHGKVVPKGYQVDHIDRNKTNNAITNLRLLDAYTNGTDPGYGDRDEDGIPF